MGAIRSFRELDVYKLARRESKQIFQFSGRFPRDERFSLTDQIRRSSRAVGAMIAEAWAHRRYPASFTSKITCALGEAMETQAWLDHALDSTYIDETSHRKLDASWQSVGAMLHKMIERADTFCNVPKP